MSVKIDTLSHQQISTLSLGEPLREASPRLRRAIRSITFTASLRSPFRWFRYYPSRN
jgi:hypothetical protein